MDISYAHYHFKWCDTLDIDSRSERGDKEMKFIDLFSGIGGFRLGMESVGHKCIGFCEIDKFARKSYKSIFQTEGEIEFHDIRDVSDDEFKKLRGKVDVICGGFPCQAFSIAGRRLGFEDTRGTLFFEIARATKQIQPRFLFLENVKGLLNHDKGRTFTTILTTLDELGFDVEWQVLNSKDFGVPQNRERVFIIGHSRKKGTRLLFPFRREGQATNPETLKALGNLNPSRSGMSGKVYYSVIAVTTAKFALFNIQSVMDLTKRDTLDMKTWGKEKSMVYLVIPDNDSTFRFLSALFFSTVFQTLTRQADIDFKGQLPLHVRVYLDEFANIGEIPDFAEQTSTVRSRNMSLVPILQNIAQLQGLYKEKEAWKTILGNCDSLVYLGGNDEDTFKFMSGLLGKQTIDVRNTSRSFGQTGSGSLSHQKIARDLMTPDEVGNMKRHECLVRIANMPVFKSKKYNSTKHPNWKYLANQESDERWWNYQINPLNQRQENHLEGLRIRDLTFESSLK